MDERLYTRFMPQLTPEQIKAFALYQDMLLEWNSRMNLTAITQPEEVASKHFADSVLPAALLPPGAKVIDVGTGAGFPGLPLRILRPDLQLTLLDSLQKRIGFLTALCQALGFADVALLHARAEDGPKGQVRYRPVPGGGPLPRAAGADRPLFEGGGQVPDV